MIPYDLGRILGLFCRPNLSNVTAAAARTRRAGTAASTGLAGAALAGEVIRRVSLGELGRAAQLLGQAKVAAPSPEVRDELQGLLVTLAAERGLLPADHSSDEEVPARDLATALRKAPRSSGAGPRSSYHSTYRPCPTLSCCRTVQSFGTRKRPKSST